MSQRGEVARPILLILAALTVTLSMLADIVVTFMVIVFLILSIYSTLKGRYSAASLSINIAYTVLVITGPRLLASMGLVVSSLVFLLVESPSIDWKPIAGTIVKGIPFWGYGLVLSLLVYWHGASGVFMPVLSREIFSIEPGLSLSLLASTIFFSLVALWIYLPGGAIPDVSVISQWLSRNKIVFVEFLVFALTILGARADNAVLFPVIAGFTAYIWVRALGSGRPGALLAYILAYTVILHVIGLTSVVDSYFTSGP